MKLAIWAVPIRLKESTFNALTSAVSKRANLAAVNPAPSKALYFVARSDGSGGSVFSDSLADHNRAVNQFQRGGKASPWDPLTVSAAQQMGLPVCVLVMLPGGN